MKIAFCIPLSWSSIPRETFKSVLAIKAPADSTFEPIIETCVPLDLNRNRLVEEAIGRRSDYIFFADMDMTFPPDCVLKLLENCTDSTPIVSGVYYRKKEPHYPVCGRYVEWSKELEPYKFSLKNKGFMYFNETQYLFYRPVDAITAKEPMQIDVSGIGCLLIKTSVFNKLNQPYFKYVNGYMDGDHTLGRISEEMMFWANVKRAGIKVLCDPRVQCRHLVEDWVGQSEASMPVYKGAPV